MTPEQVLAKLELDGYGGVDVADTIAALRTVLEDRDSLRATFWVQGVQDELGLLETFKSSIEEAHRKHLSTGDYILLGMAAQDAIRAYDKAKEGEA